MNRFRSLSIHRIHRLLPALKAAGVYRSASAYHCLWFAATIALYATSFGALLGEPSLGVRILAIVGTAIAVMQLGLFAHEVGHGAVTRNVRLREFLGQLSNSFLIGFGFSHWQHTHPVHHNHPNTEGVDPDIESGGYALYESSARRDRGIAARFQPATLFLGFLLWGFGIRIVAVMYALRHFNRRTAVDLACVAGHVALWIGLSLAFGSLSAMAINYVAITVLNGVYMGAILVVPHVGTGSRAREDELPYFERQVTFSRNYNASALGTILCGGLNLQIEHHLLPSVPCIRLRRAKPVVEAYCKANGLPYHQTSYVDAWREVALHCRRMSHRVRDNATIPQAQRVAP